MGRNLTAVGRLPARRALPMKRFAGRVDRARSTLFAETLEDLIAEDSAVRETEAFVKGLDPGAFIDLKIGRCPIRPLTAPPYSITHRRLAFPHNQDPLPTGRPSMESVISGVTSGAAVRSTFWHHHELVPIAHLQSFFPSSARSERDGIS